ncbi:MAG: hypothetical protein Q4A00_05040 [Flavobacteriaceae bacterium]|nr:hypothetical protein [Flavobacteriaceae bacterium]
MITLEEYKRLKAELYERVPEKFSEKELERLIVEENYVTHNNRISEYIKWSKKHIEPKIKMLEAQLSDKNLYEIVSMRVKYYSRKQSESGVFIEAEEIERMIQDEINEIISYKSK